MSHSGVHDSTLVLLSFAVAIVASYTALDLASRMRATSGMTCWAWLVAAAITMGGGIWSMHFVAMLAFSIPGMEVAYDFGLTAVSFLIPVLVTAGAFAVVNRRESGPVTVGVSGFVMGLGIAAMHYTGMAAMRMPAFISYDAFWVSLSLLIAVGASTVAILLSFRQANFYERLGAAVVMGLAVAGMHYAAMMGATFTHRSASDFPSGAASVGQSVLALWVTSTTFIILILALLAAAMDRSYARKVEQEAASLRASEERFRLLVQSVTDYALFMLHPDGRIANWNQGAERIKGYMSSEIIGRHFSAFYTDEDRRAGKPQRVLEEAASAGKFEDEGWRVRKDGSRFWASVVIDPVRDDHGNLIGFAKITRDVSERKAAQEELERAREALFQAQKMEAIGQLTGGVAHDFNNLLMAVLGSLELARKRTSDDPKTVRLIDNAIQGAKRGVSLTQRMLAFSRRQHLRPEPIRLPELVNEMADLLNQTIGPQHRIEIQFPLDLPSALVDPHQLELALLNLVVNARDAMPDGGTISISGTEREELVNEHKRQFVCLTVSDTGIGMEPETLARAVEPFFTTKGVGKGTGLGLSMVQGLAEQSQGKLVIASRPGSGTKAEIWLPSTSSASQHVEQIAEQHTEKQRSSLRVLLVDDDPLVLENAAAMLEDLGHHVLEAASGQEALAILDYTGDLDVVIADYAMPGMTGAELSARITRDRPNLPVIMATGYAELSNLSAQVRLQKPYSQSDLSVALSALSERR